MRKRCAGGCGRSLDWHDDSRCERCAERVAAQLRANGHRSTSRPAEALDGLERRMTALEADLDDLTERTR